MSEPLTLMMITNDVRIATHAVMSGVNRLFVDLETIGKFERQGHLDTHRAAHTPSDVAALRRALPQAEILARVNPIHPSSKVEIEALLRAGADYLMLPMFESREHVAKFLDLVAGRARTTLLLETAQALGRIDDILELRDGIDEIHVGLNDLHLAMKLDFMFELVSEGVVEFLSTRIRGAGVRFGFGGVACLGGGAVPAELVLAEHVRLGSEMVILGRTFHGQAKTLEDLRQRLDLRTEIGRLRDCESELRAGDRAVLAQRHQEFQERVRAIARQRRGEIATRG